MLEDLEYKQTETKKIICNNSSVLNTLKLSFILLNKFNKGNIVWSYYIYIYTHTRTSTYY